MPYKIFLVDDHAVVREGLKTFLEKQSEYEVCGTSDDAHNAIAALASLDPDMVIIDISLDGMNGLDLTKQLRAKYPKMHLLILSMHKEFLYAERALRAGANGYVMKQENGQHLLAAIEHIRAGQTAVSAAVQERLNADLTSSASRPSPSDEVLKLSNRELEVFQLIANGYGTRQMAEALHVSMKTIETHREHIRHKLNLKSTFELNQHALAWAATGKL